MCSCSGITHGKCSILICACNLVNIWGWEVLRLNHPSSFVSKVLTRIDRIASATYHCVKLRQKLHLEINKQSELPNCECSISVFFFGCGYSWDSHPRYCRIDVTFDLQSYRVIYRDNDSTRIWFSISQSYRMNYMISIYLLSVYHYLCSCKITNKITWINCQIEKRFCWIVAMNFPFTVLFISCMKVSLASY